jgi:hypothetical protein
MPRDHTINTLTHVAVLARRVPPAPGLRATLLLACLLSAYSLSSSSQTSMPSTPPSLASSSLLRLSGQQVCQAWDAPPDQVGTSPSPAACVRSRT